MSFNATDLLKLVQDFGETLTLRKVTTDGIYDAATGTLSGSETTDYSFTGYFYNLAEGTSDLTQTRKGRRACVIPTKGLSVVPDDQDQILRTGETVDIMTVKTILSNGQAVCYLCEVME
jgi:hypothetical protein